MIIKYGWHTYTECVEVSKSDESVICQGIRRHSVYQLTIDRVGLELAETDGDIIEIPEGYADVEIVK